jgi:hypothetical protein
MSRTRRAKPIAATFLAFESVEGFCVVYWHPLCSASACVWIVPGTAP